MYCNPVFWKNKKVFITGHTGFKGGWLTLWLHSMGAQVAGYALAPDAQGQTHSFFQATELAELCHHEVGDIRNLEQLKAAVIRFQPEIVFHMAAQPLVRASYQNPVETYSTNVMGTVHLLEAVRHCPSVQTCVVITTDKCYENKEWSWGYREVDRLG
jgi:CDP-glucose 4,6-dehydratase